MRATPRLGGLVRSYSLQEAWCWDRHVVAVKLLCSSSPHVEPSPFFQAVEILANPLLCGKTSDFRLIPISFASDFRPSAVSSSTTNVSRSVIWQWRSSRMVLLSTIASRNKCSKDGSNGSAAEILCLVRVTVLTKSCEATILARGRLKTHVSLLRSVFPLSGWTEDRFARMRISEARRCPGSRCPGEGNTNRDGGRSSSF